MPKRKRRGRTTFMPHEPRIALRQKLFGRQSGLCYLCGQPMALYIGQDQTLRPLMATFDHLVPRVEGGSHDESNLKLAHGGCNSARGTGNVVGVPLVCVAAQ